MCLLIAWMLLMIRAAVSPLVVHAAEGTGQETQNDSSDSSGLVIEVVGEHSIDDEIVIEDEEVPLAMFSEEPADAGVRHAVMMGLVFCGAVGYVVYFRRYDEKLFGLRREAAEAEKRLMDKRNSKNGERI